MPPAAQVEGTQPVARQRVGACGRKVGGWMPFSGWVRGAVPLVAVGWGTGQLGRAEQRRASRAPPTPLCSFEYGTAWPFFLGGPMCPCRTALHDGRLRPAHLAHLVLNIINLHYLFRYFPAPIALHDGRLRHTSITRAICLRKDLFFFINSHFLLVLLFLPAPTALHDDRLWPVHLHDAGQHGAEDGLVGLVGDPVPQRHVECIVLASACACRVM